MFGRTDIVGETISVDGRSFLVVGVLADAGESIIGSENSNIIIPYTTAQRMFYVSGVTSFTITAGSSELVDQAEADVTTALMQRFKDEDAFSVMNQSSILESMDSITLSLIHIWFPYDRKKEKPMLPHELFFLVPLIQNRCS